MMADEEDIPARVRRRYVKPASTVASEDSTMLRGFLPKRLSRVHLNAFD